MNASELIAHLQGLMALHGDLPTLIGSPERGVEPEEVVYYDGGNGFIWIQGG